MVTDASDGKAGLKLAASVPAHIRVFSHKVWDAISLYKRSVISSTQDVKVSGQGQDSREGETCNVGLLTTWPNCLDAIF